MYQCPRCKNIERFDTKYCVNEECMYLGFIHYIEPKEDKNTKSPDEGALDVTSDF